MLGPTLTQLQQSQIMGAYNDIGKSNTPTPLNPDPKKKKTLFPDKNPEFTQVSDPSTATGVDTSTIA